MTGEAAVVLDAHRLPPLPASIVDEMAWNHLRGYWPLTGNELGAGVGFDDYWLEVQDSYLALAERQHWLALAAAECLRHLLASGRLKLAGDGPAELAVDELAQLLRVGLMEVAATAMTTLADIKTDAHLDGRQLEVTVPLPE